MLYNIESKVLKYEQIFCSCYPWAILKEVLLKLTYAKSFLVKVDTYCMATYEHTHTHTHTHTHSFGYILQKNGHRVLDLHS
jgi:hypothetical protein